MSGTDILVALDHRAHIVLPGGQNGVRCGGWHTLLWDRGDTAEDEDEDEDEEDEEDEEERERGVQVLEPGPLRMPWRARNYHDDYYREDEY
eukprot:2744550-Rhodomonas_salina.3